MFETWRSPNGKKHLSYSPEFALDVIEKFKSGMAAIDIAKDTGWKSYMICFILKRAGLNPRDRQRHGKVYSKELISRLVLFYQKHRSTREAEIKFKINRRVIRDILIRENEFQPEWEEKPMLEDTILEMIETWNSGWTLSRIAKLYGFSRNRIHRTFVERKVNLKSKRRRSNSGGRALNKKSGYWWVHVPLDDPMRIMATPAGAIMEHRLVMARHMNRPLTKNESVHHIDGDKGNNKLENLQLRHGCHGKGIVLKCNCCGSTDIIEVPLA